MVGYFKSDDHDRNEAPRRRAIEQTKPGRSVRFRFRRPPLRDRTISVRIDDELYQRIDQAAAHEGRTLSAFLRAAAMNRADLTLTLPRRPHLYRS